MPLRLIHTSDWHLGHTLHDIDRSKEHRAFLAWLARLCESEHAHALLVAGDLFEVSNPPAAAVELLAEFLVGLWRRLPELQVIAIGGNHDSAYRLEATEPYLNALGRLHVLGALPRRDGAIDPDRALIRVEGEGESALIVAVPFLRAADLRSDELEGDAAAPVRRVHDELFGAARRRLRSSEALVLLGHLFVSGGTSAGSERLVIGGVGAVPADVFPKDVAYAALGHLHRAQVIDGRLRYSGAPIPLSFDEAAYEQEVVVVHLAGGKVLLARSVPTPKTRPLLRVPSDAPASLEAVLEAIRSLPAQGDLCEDEIPLLEARILLDKPEPSLRARLDEALAGRAARLVTWQVNYAGDGNGLGDTSTVGSLSDLDPVDVFKKRWASRFEGEPPEDLLGAFNELLAEARGLACETPEVHS